jgi:hypothetical protein
LNLAACIIAGAAATIRNDSRLIHPAWASMKVDESEHDDIEGLSEYSSAITTNEKELQYQGLAQFTFGFGFVF